MSETIWLCIGFGAQALFTMRFIVQWLASEREGRSVVPVSFWLLSIGGSLTLLAYAIYRRDPVFIVAQMTGSFIYLRNLSLLRRERLGLPPAKRLGWAKVLQLLAAIPLLFVLLAQGATICYSLRLPANPRPDNLGNWPANVAALPQKAPGTPVRFAVVGDVQRFGTFERLAEKIKQQPLDFLVLLGDVTYPPPTVTGHRLAQLELAECHFPFPVFYVVGNHAVHPESFPLARWRKTYGPDQFWFEYGGNLFVFVDTLAEASHGHTDASKFLDDVLRAHGSDVRRKFVFNHVPLAVGPDWSGRKMTGPEARRIEQLLYKYKVDYFICGDYHGFASVQKGDTCFLVSGGGGAHLKGSVLGFHHATILTVLEDRIQTRLAVTTKHKAAADSLERSALLKLLPLMSARPVETALADVLILAVLFLLLRRVVRRRRASAEERSQKEHR